MNLRCAPDLLERRLRHIHANTKYETYQHATNRVIAVHAYDSCKHPSFDESNAMPW